MHYSYYSKTKRSQEPGTKIHQRTKTKILSLVTLSLGISLAFPLGSPTKSFAAPPVEISVDQAYLEKLSPERRRALENLIEALKKEVDVKALENYHPQLPPSQLEHLQGRIIELSSLFKKPTSDELPSLAYEEDGRQKRLSPDQIEAIRTEGMFQVPSREFPGQFHVWKVSTLLVEGSHKTQISFEENISSAVGHIFVKIPKDIVGSKDKPGAASAKNGVEHILSGLRGTLSTVVGLVEEKRKYSDREVDQILEDRKREFILKNLNNGSAPGAADYFDPRMFDPELTKTLLTDVQRIQSEHNTFWQTSEAEVRRNLKRDFKERFPEKDAGQLENMISNRLDEISFEHLSRRFRDDEQLQEKSPGYGDLYANHLMAVRVGEKIEKALQDRVIAEEMAIRTQLSQEHRLLSRNKEWLEPRVRERSHAFYLQIRWEYLERIPTELDEKGLHQEANVYRQILEFQKTSEANIKAQAEAENTAAREFSFESRIWNSLNWVKKEYRDEDGNIRFRPEKYETTEVRTDQWFWRWRLIGHETTADFKNGLYRVVVTNLWNGPIGVTALFNPHDSFYASKIMDQNTGDIVDDPHSERTTYMGHLKNHWRKIFEARQRFEDTPDRGLIGKAYIRWLNQFWNYGVKGGIGTLAIGLGQPVVTVCNVGASCFAVATTPVWAPTSSLFKAGFTVVYDFNSPASRDSRETRHRQHRWFALPGHGLLDFGLLGLGQTSLKVTQAGVFEPLMFAGKGMYAGLRKWTRSHYDTLMRRVFISRAHVPAQDGFGAKRIQGPGLASRYYFQVQPEIAIMALQAVLEREELRLVEKRDQALIDRPLNQFYDFFSSIAKPFVGEVDLSKGTLDTGVRQERDRHTKELRGAVAERNQTLSHLSELPYGIDRSRIKQTQEDLERTLTVSQKLVESFYEEHLLPAMNQFEVDRTAVAGFWKSKDVAEGDFNGLTRYFYATVFDNEFLTPLQETDKDFIIEVKDDELKDIVAHFPVVK